MVGSGPPSTWFRCRSSGNSSAGRPRRRRLREGSGRGKGTAMITRASLLAVASLVAAQFAGAVLAGPGPAHAAGFEVPDGFVSMPETSPSPSKDWEPVLAVRPDEGPFAELTSLSLRRVKGSGGRPGRLTQGAAHRRRSERCRGQRRSRQPRQPVRGSGLRGPASGHATAVRRLAWPRPDWCRAL